jgi:hypothetical protein
LPQFWSKTSSSYFDYELTRGKIARRLSGRSLGWANVDSDRVLCLVYDFRSLGGVRKEVTSRPKVHGIEFSSNQSELVKGLIRELLKDGNCAVYALPHMKPNGELRMASTPPAPSPRHQHGVFLRIRPEVNAAVAIRPMNAKTGAERTNLSKYSQQELLETIRLWRKEVTEITPEPPVTFELPTAA